MWEPNKTAARHPEAVRDGRGQVRRVDGDRRRVHHRAPRRQNRAAARRNRASPTRRSGTASTTAPIPAGRQFFRTMRHYLEHHAGKPRTTIKVVGKLPGSLDEAWARLTGPAGLGFEPAAGKVFSTRTGAGETLSGEVVFASGPNTLELTLRELDDAFLAHSMSSGAALSSFTASSRCLEKRLPRPTRFARSGRRGSRPC